MEAFVIWTAIILSLPFLTHEPQTTVVLLENESEHNAVEVATQTGSVTVDRAYFTTTLVSAEKNPSVPEQADPDAIRQKYAAELGILPPKPVSVLFYFEPGTSQITEDSKNQVDELIRIIASNEPAAVDIIGYSDTAGDADKNYTLALERAKEVEKFLFEKNVKLQRISITSHGEKDLLVPTQDGVSEPQNRRVEVIVR